MCSRSIACVVLGAVSIFMCSSCAILNDPDLPDPPRFEQMNIQYGIWGGWINSYKVTIDSAGTVRVAELQWGAPEYIQVGTRILVEDERKTVEVQRLETVARLCLLRWLVQVMLKLRASTGVI